MKIEIKSVTTGVEGDLTPDEAAIIAARGDYMEDSLVGNGINEALEGATLQDSDLVFLKEVGKEWSYTEDHVERRWNNYGEEKFPESFIRQAKKRKLIAELLRRGHFGPFEHIQFFFAVEDVSRTAMAQITRHRHMSFDVQSQRYANFSDKSPVVPPSFKDTEYVNNPLVDENPTFEKALLDHWDRCVKKYNSALDKGIPKEDARFFLPQATPVNLTFSANMRSLMHFFDLRNNQKAQWEARDFASRLLELVKEEAPLTFKGYEKYLNNNSLRAP